MVRPSGSGSGIFYHRGPLHRMSRLKLVARARRSKLEPTPLRRRMPLQHTATATFSAPITAGTKIGQDIQVSCVVPLRPDQQEIQRRRELVRTLFNDFWSGRDDKPAAFVDRLDEAETYLNERLTACGESWRLEASTRKMLGLPPRSNSRKDGSGAAHRRGDCFTAGTPPVGVRHRP